MKEITIFLLQISHEFRGLSKLYQDVIADITKKMGHGMTVFFTRELNTEAEWDEVWLDTLIHVYGHFVCSHAVCRFVVR